MLTHLIAIYHIYLLEKAPKLKYFKDIIVEHDNIEKTF